MRVLFLILILLSSSTAYAEWLGMIKNDDGDTYYVDFDRIREIDGYVYYWQLADYVKPISNEFWSAKTYHQGDCKLFRFKHLTVYFHKEPIGGGDGKIIYPTNSDKWMYPPPNSPTEYVLKSVCDKEQHSWLKGKASEYLLKVK